MALTPAQLQDLNARIGWLLDKHLAPIFKPGVQLTFIARTSGNDEADVLVTTERDLNDVIALALRSLWTSGHRRRHRRGAAYPWRGGLPSRAGASMTCPACHGRDQGRNCLLCLHATRRVFGLHDSDGGHQVSDGTSIRIPADSEDSPWSVLAQTVLVLLIVFGFAGLFIAYLDDWAAFRWVFK